MLWFIQNINTRCKTLMKQNSMDTLSFATQVYQWFKQKPALNVIFDTLTQAGYAPRFVGGCVRDVLFNSMGGAYDGGDFDIAVPCPPETTTEILQSAGIKVIPTGLDFGSITAVIEGEHYEITSLRRDVETDGRRAVVSYSTDWAIDAERRDFTINAMSLDRDGTLYDYFTGIADAQAGIVRFVGDADLRVQEDILRILRYYRFDMLYGQNSDPTPSTKEAWHACQTHASKINQLSRERIWGEMCRILSIPEACKITDCLSLMKQHGVLQMILPENLFDGDKFSQICQRLDAIAEFNKNHSNATAMARLVVLHQGIKQPREVCLKRLSTSKKDNHIWDILTTPIDGNDMCQLYSSLDTYGQAYTHARLILWDGHITDTIINDINNFVAKPFPLSGGDIMALGIPAGEQVGVLLKQAKHHWYQSKCTLDKTQLLSIIQQ